MPQDALPAVLMRGGTSTGLFFREQVLPDAGEERDRAFLEALGSPDPSQIDGVGGGTSSTSKIMVVASSRRDDADVDYLFGQAAVDRPVMDYRANCGNLTAAVGPFAIDEGLVSVADGTSTLVLYNRNTGVRVRATVPVVEGRAAVQGSTSIAGVPRPGAPILTEFLDPAGAVFGQLLPTGRACDEVEGPFGAVAVSLVDASNPCAFVRATDVGLVGDETPAQLNEDAGILARLEQVRSACAVLLGLVDTPGEAARRSASLPQLVVLSAADGSEEADVRARVASVQLVHHACPMTALMCTAAAGRVPGSIVEQLASPRDVGELHLSHPKGVATATVRVRPDAVGGSVPDIEAVGVTRTARRLMAGEVYYRRGRGGSR